MGAAHEPAAPAVSAVGGAITQLRAIELVVVDDVQLAVGPDREGGHIDDLPTLLVGVLVASVRQLLDRCRGSGGIALDRNIGPVEFGIIARP